MRKITTFLALLLAVSPHFLNAEEVEQVRKVQIVLPIEREDVQTNVSVQVPFLYHGELTLAEFKERFTRYDDVRFIEFLEAVQTGKGNLASMVEQGPTFRITDEKAFRATMAKTFFPTASTLKVIGVIPHIEGRAYLLEIEREGGDRRKLAIVTVATKEGLGETLVQAVTDYPLIDVIEKSIAHPLSAQELRKVAKEEGIKPIGWDLWDHLRPQVMKPTEDDAFSKSLAALIVRLEKGDLEGSVTPGSLAYLRAGQDKTAILNRSKQLAAPLKAAKQVFVFNPVYAVIPSDKAAPPVLLISDPEKGLLLANVGRNDAFTRVLELLRGHPIQLPKVIDETESETAPH